MKPRRPTRRTKDEGATVWPPRETAPDGEASAESAAYRDAKPEAVNTSERGEPPTPSPQPSPKPRPKPTSEADVRRPSPQPSPTPPVRRSQRRSQADAAPKPARRRRRPQPAQTRVPAAALPRRRCRSRTRRCTGWRTASEPADEAGRPSRITMPSYDPRAPVAGRTPCRASWSAAPASIALMVAGLLYVQAQNRHARRDARTPTVAEPARDLTDARRGGARRRTRSARRSSSRTWRWSPTRASRTRTSWSRTASGRATRCRGARDRVSPVPGAGAARDARRSGARGPGRAAAVTATRPARRRRLPLADSAGALRRRRAAAARVARGRAGADPPRRARARSWPRSRADGAPTVPKGSGCGPCCASRPRCGPSGVTHVAGVDEAGMSPLAGPVAAAAVIFARGTRIPDVDDSKRLSAERARALAPIIRERAVAWAVAFAEVDEIDCINIYWAGLRRCVGRSRRCRPAAEHLLIDGRRLRDAAAAAAAHRQGRHQEPVDRGRVDPGEDGARRAHARARRRSFPVTGSPSTRAIPYRRTSARLRRLGRLPDPPAIVRAPCARCWGCRRCRPGRAPPARRHDGAIGRRRVARGLTPALRLPAALDSMSRNLRRKCGRAAVSAVDDRRRPGAQ